MVADEQMSSAVTIVLQLWSGRIKGSLKAAEHVVLLRIQGWLMLMPGTQTKWVSRRSRERKRYRELSSLVAALFISPLPDKHHCFLSSPGSLCFFLVLWI
jgi:hypothetical protein